VIRVGCTAGVSIFPRDGDEIETLIAHADIALYRAKLKKRGPSACSRQRWNSQIRERRALQRELAVASPDEEFEIYYQPQATAQAASSVRSLAALASSGARHVSPAIFIPLAKRPDDRRDRRMGVTQRLREAASWSNPLGIAINFSPLDFRRLDVPTLILRCCSRPSGGVPAGSRNHGRRADRRFRRAVGSCPDPESRVRVAMDDFGAGYSSLSYLQSFPFTRSRSTRLHFQVETNADSAAIVERVLSLSRTLNLR